VWFEIGGIDKGLSVLSENDKQDAFERFGVEKLDNLILKYIE